MADENTSASVTVTAYSGLFAIGFWGGVPIIVPPADFPTLEGAQAAAVALYGMCRSQVSVMATNGVALKESDLFMPNGWNVIDDVTAESWADGKQTVNQMEMSARHSRLGDTDVFGDEVADDDYVLVADNETRCTVYSVLNAVQDARVPAEGQWVFRIGGRGTFDAPGPNWRDVSKVPKGMLIEAQDAPGETPVVHTFSIGAVEKYDPIFPYPVPTARFGKLIRDANGADVISIGTGTDIDGPFGGKVAYIAAVGSYPSGDIANGIRSISPPGSGFEVCDVEFARPATPLPDDDDNMYGHIGSLGNFFAGVEIVATQCTRVTGWATQYDAYSEPKAGEQSIQLAGGDEGIGNANTSFVNGHFVAGGLARCGEPAFACLYTSQWPAGFPTGGGPMISDPKTGFMVIAADFPASFTLINGEAVIQNSFQYIETFWKYRAVYVQRTSKGPTYLYSDWTNPFSRFFSEGTGQPQEAGHLLYCPFTPSAAHVRSRVGEHISSLRGVTETRHFTQYGYSVHTGGLDGSTVSNPKVARTLYNSPYYDEDSIDVPVTGIFNDTELIVDFDEIPNAESYLALVNRHGNNYFPTKPEPDCPPEYDGGGVPDPPDRPENWTFEAIKPGGKIGFNGATQINISVIANIKAYKNGSRNRGIQCPAKHIGVYYNGAPYASIGSRYSIAGGFEVAVFGVSGFNGRVEDSSYGAASVYVTPDGKSAKLKLCHTFNDAPYGQPDHFVSIVLKLPEDDITHLFPSPHSWPGPWPLAYQYKGQKNLDYRGTNPANQELFKSDKFSDCSSGTAPRPKYWRGHVKLWIAKQGQQAPEYEANSAVKASLLDGRLAYWADVIEIPGISLSLSYRGIVGYDERYDLPLPEKSEAYIQLAYQLAGLIPSVRDQVQRIIDAQTHLYFSPVTFDGPFLFYVNSDQDLYADQSVTFQNYLGAKNEQQLYTGDLPGNPLHKAVEVGPTDGAVSVGTINVGGVTVNLFTAPAKKR